MVKTFAFLLLLSSACADLLSRLQNLAQEPDDEPTGNLNAHLAKRLLNANTSWIREETYYTPRGISRTSLEVAVSVKQAECKSDLRQRVLNLYLETEVTLREKSFKFRDETKIVVFQGVAALGANGVDWVLLDCKRRYYINSNNGNGSPNGERALWNMVGESLERELENSLEQLVRQRFKSVPNTQTSQSLPYKTEDSNALLDAAISLIVFIVKTKYNDTIKIPDIKEGVTLNLLLFGLDSGLSASGGVARQVSSLKRLGDARIDNRNLTIHFAGAVIFQRLNIEYDEYRAAVLGLGTGGYLNLTAEPVSVGLALRIDFGRRRVFLDRFRIKKLGPTKLDAGLGPGKLLSVLAETFLNIIRRQILHFLERRIASYTREALRKNTLDQIIDGNLQL